MSIGRIHLVMVPSTDHDRSIAFYEGLGFSKRVDFGFGDGDAERWVELFPPDGACGVALSGRADGGAVGVDTGIIVTTEDIDAAHARFVAAGRDVDPEVAREGSPASIRVGSAQVVGPTPAMFHLRDPDGNALLVVGP